MHTKDNFHKPTLLSPDYTAENIQKLAALFPNCVTEGPNGKAIDFDLLKAELGHVVEGQAERYRMEWPGKREAIRQANTPSNRTLRPVVAESVNFESTENVYIEGDNLETLKLLQESYLGKIKVIYIDPPYNTGKDFVYKDDFRENIESFREKAQLTDEYKNKLQANPDSSGRFHSDWLSMMYPRLKLARNLLMDDGVIFISIDDHEVHNLRRLGDDIFGEKNFVGKLILQTATDNNPSQINTEHEYVLCLAKNLESLPKWTIKSEAAQKIQDKYLDLKKRHQGDIDLIQRELRKWIKSEKENLPKVSHYDNVDEKGVYHDADIANTKFGGYKYEILHPTTCLPCKIPEKGFRYPKASLIKMIADNEVLFGVDEKTLIKPKKRLTEAKDLLRSVIYEDGRTSTKELESIIGRSVFENPKSHFILKRILAFASSPDSIILDFFSGSATTAHAVMQLNAEDGGNRKFIMVQLPEETPENSEARKAGYQNICEIGKERIRRAGTKIKEETGKEIDHGFRVFRLDESNMRDVYFLPEELRQDQLDLFADNVKDDRSDEDLLVETMLNWGLPLTLKIETTRMAGKKIFKVDHNALLACFETGITEDFIKEAVALQPLRILFRDASFANDTVKENIRQLMKQLNGNIELRVI